MLKDDFINICNQGMNEKGNELMIVDIQIKDNKGIETIINTKLDFENKFKYYLENYDENMEHKKAPGIFIKNVYFGEGFMIGNCKS